MMFRALLLFLAIASTAHAGAWPRGKGNGFAMVSFQVTASGLGGPVSYYTGSFVEYGLTDKLTLGSDVGHGVSGSSKALIFISYPIGVINDKHRFAAEIGVGRIAGNTVVRPGFNYGRGIKNRFGEGWVTLDTLFEHHLGEGHTDVKLDFTFGLNHGRGFKSMLQLQAGKQRGDPGFLRLAPSFAMPIGQKMHFELGFSSSLRGPSEYGIKAGVWRKF
ncbi:hypothetical protein KO498_16685 [Lentibacter algarum]|uniref:hypothetical protein n=1 Tax=Lentibacter algarum TaxID=576131 RepID=UPI001C0A02F0|nr:hypothetical protein [Lentibacter algarum]MBU2983444.1 hypothetical protein [Lentibacter algarum]